MIKIAQGHVIKCHNIQTPVNCLSYSRMFLFLSSAAVLSSVRTLSEGVGSVFVCVCVGVVVGDAVILFLPPIPISSQHHKTRKV